MARVKFYCDSGANIHSSREDGGHAIAFEERSGKFAAVISGKPTKAGSLDGIKKKIDAALDSEFQPFACIERDSKGFESFNVTGLIRPKGKPGGWRNRPKFSTNRKQKYRGHEVDMEVVTLDTPENRALLVEMEAHEQESERISKERREQYDAMQKRMVNKRAEDFLR